MSKAIGLVYDEWLALVDIVCGDRDTIARYLRQQVMSSGATALLLLLSPSGCIAEVVQPDDESKWPKYKVNGMEYLYASIAKCFEKKDLRELLRDLYTRSSSQAFSNRTTIASVLGGNR